MNILIQLAFVLVCLRTVHLFPVQDGDSSMLPTYGIRLAKKDFYNHKGGALTPFQFISGVRGMQGQRKKAVDSTFIRFGRSSPLQQVDLPLLEDPPQEEIPRKFLLDRDGCRVTSTEELMRALMTDPNCIRAFSKSKRENVNDTFIRFGKRSVPDRVDPEK